MPTDESPKPAIQVTVCRAPEELRKAGAARWVASAACTHCSPAGAADKGVSIVSNEYLPDEKSIHAELVSSLRETGCTHDAGPTEWSDGHGMPLDLDARVRIGLEEAQRDGVVISPVGPPGVN